MLHDVFVWNKKHLDHEGLPVSSTAHYQIKVILISSIKPGMGGGWIPPDTLWGLSLYEPKRCVPVNRAYFERMVNKGSDFFLFISPK